MLEIGAVIGSYRIEGEIDRGGFAVVYRARHVHLDVIRAVKVGWARGDALRLRVRLEGCLQSKLEHQNVVSILEMLEHEGHPVLVLEYVDGPTLGAYLDLGLMPIPMVDALAEGMLAGLAAAHRVDVIHRDLKPSNVLLAPAPPGSDLPFVPKVSDFGLARLLGSGTALTAAGGIFGTPMYMSPEQFRDPRRVDARADLFSLGCVLYEMLAGTPAFSGGDIRTLEERISSGRWIPLGAHRPDAPNRMIDAVHACLAPSRDRRPRDCEALLAIWRGQARPQAARAPHTIIPPPHGAPGPGTPMRVVDPARPEVRVIRRRRGLVWSSAAGVLSGSGAAVSLMLWMQSGPTQAAQGTEADSDGKPTLADSGAEAPLVEPVVAAIDVTQVVPVVPPPKPKPAPPPPVPPPDPPPDATLTVGQAADGWAWVYVDGQLAPKSPFRALPLDPGRHTITIDHSILGGFVCAGDLPPAGDVRISVGPGGATISGAADADCTRR